MNADARLEQIVQESRVVRRSVNIPADGGGEYQLLEFWAARSSSIMGGVRVILVRGERLVWEQDVRLEFFRGAWYVNEYVSRGDARVALHRVSWFPNRDVAAEWMAVRVFHPSRGERPSCLLCSLRLNGRRSRYGFCDRCHHEGPPDHDDVFEWTRLYTAVRALGGWSALRRTIIGNPDLERALRSLHIQGERYAVWELLTLELQSLAPAAPLPLAEPGTGDWR